MLASPGSRKVIRRHPLDIVALLILSLVAAGSFYQLTSGPFWCGVNGAGHGILVCLVAHHKRRHRKSDLIAKISRSGLASVRSFYRNALPFVRIWCARRICGLLRIRLNSEGQVNTPVLNWVHARAFTFDAWLAPTNVLPFGVSLLVVASNRCAV